MSIALEYMQRTGTLNNYLAFPFSLFIYNKNDLSKRIIAVHKCDNIGNITVKHWHISDCKPDQCLPSMDEYVCGNSLKYEHIVLDQFDLIDLRYQSTIKSNFKYNSSPLELYLEDSDNYLKDFDTYNQKKEIWLWNNFLSIYLPELVILGMRIKRSLGLYQSENCNSLIMNEQLLIVEQEFSSDFKLWNLWKKHFLYIQGIPGEIAYKTLYLKNNLKSKII